MQVSFAGFKNPKNPGIQLTNKSAPCRNPESTDRFNSDQIQFYGSKYFRSFGLEFDYQPVNLSAPWLFEGLFFKSQRNLKISI